MRHAFIWLAAALALLAAMALKGALLPLPAPPSQPTETAFDANRAAARLARILGDQRPHPVDSAANDAVRERLIAEMRAVGLQPRVTDDFVCNGTPSSRGIACARVRNVVATIGPGADGMGGRHLLLASHYDSTFAGPGAADDGIGVATMLEVAANLHGRPLARPVTFLFDEGEEMGLLGARAFLDRDPLAGRIDMLINLEARGVNGPAIMFETSRPNGPAIAWYRAAPRPVANSLSTDLYGLIPNSTDVSVFNERPWTILNFAVIGNETRYHSAGDNLAALDRRSLQHMGAQTLAVAERAAAGDLPAATGTRLYTDLVGRVLIVLPLLFGLILLGLLLLFFLVETWRRRAFGRPLLAMAAAIGGSAAVALGGHMIVGLLRAGEYWRALPVATTSAVYASALAASAAALLLIGGTAERTRLRAAFWLLFLLIGGAICAVAPGAAIYFLLPPLAAAAGMALSRRLAWAEAAGAIAACTLLSLTFGPALGLFEVLLSGGPLWAFAPLGAVILLPMLIELTPLLARIRPLIAHGIAVGLAVLLWAGAALAPAYSPARQQLFTIEYVLDNIAHNARLAVNNDGAPIDVGAGWRRVTMPYTTRKRWVRPIPIDPAARLGSHIELLAQESRPDGVHVLLRLYTDSPSTTLLAPADAPIRAAGAAGFPRPFGRGAPDDRFALRCVGHSCIGREFEIVLSRAAPIAFTVVTTRPGLPPIARDFAAARGPLARPQYAPDSTIRLDRFELLPTDRGSPFYRGPESPRPPGRSEE